MDTFISPDGKHLSSEQLPGYLPATLGPNGAHPQYSSFLYDDLLDIATQATEFTQMVEHVEAPGWAATPLPRCPGLH